MEWICEGFVAKGHICHEEWRGTGAHAPHLALLQVLHAAATQRRAAVVDLDLATGDAGSRGLAPLRFQVRGRGEQQWEEGECGWMWMWKHRIRGNELDDLARVI